MSVNCPHCGEPVTVGDSFCGECGMSLVATEANSSHVDGTAPGEIPQIGRHFAVAFLASAAMFYIVSNFGFVYENFDAYYIILLFLFFMALGFLIDFISRSYVRRLIFKYQIMIAVLFVSFDYIIEFLIIGDAIAEWNDIFYNNYGELLFIAFWSAAKALAFSIVIFLLTKTICKYIDVKRSARKI